MKKNWKVTSRMILLRKRALVLTMRKQKTRMITRALRSCKMTGYVLSKTNWQFQKAGYFCRVSPQKICSAIQGYSAKFVEMQSIL